MTHRGPFQPLPFCDSVSLMSENQNIFFKITGSWHLIKYPDFVKKKQNMIKVERM